MPRELYWEVAPVPPQFESFVYRAWYCRGKPDGEYLALVFQAYGSDRCMSLYQLAAGEKATQLKHASISAAQEHVQHILSMNAIVPRRWE